MHIPNFGDNKPFHFTFLHNGKLQHAQLSEIKARPLHWWVHSEWLCGTLFWQDGDLHFKDAGSGWGIHLEVFREVLIRWYG